uniref:Mediator of RNA polymerase II transcription subunit 11 n=1 Tax=Globodera rostochiensis TaxID=31243 RepID=A0A914HPZ7_GLORO
MSSSTDGGTGGSAGGAAAGPSSVEPVVLPVEQLMADVAERCPPTLDQRLQSMDTVDRRIDDLLTVVAEVLLSLDKDKPLSKAKMEELYKKYEQRLGDIQRGITEQLTYMEQVCVGAEHQGSTFHYHQVAELSAARLQSLHAQLSTLRDTSNGINRAEEEAVTAAAADDENKSVGGDEQPQGME